MFPMQAMLKDMQGMEAKKEKPRNIETWIILKDPVVILFKPLSYASSPSHYKRGGVGKWTFSETLDDQFEISFGFIFSLHIVGESSFYYEEHSPKVISRKTEKKNKSSWPVPQLAPPLLRIGDLADHWNRLACCLSPLIECIHVWPDLSLLSHVGIKYFGGS